MKILEAQNGVMTNLEVYEFLSNQSKEYNAQKRRGPGNLETLRRELLQYFEAAPSPLSQKPAPYSSADFSTLMKRLRPYSITKGEFVMIMNLRPTSIPNLNTVLEEMETRFTPEQQEEIVQAVIDVLGEPPVAPDAGEEGDAMETTEDGS